MQVDSVGRSKNMEQSKYSHGPCSRQEYIIYGQNSAHNKVGFPPEIIIHTCHNEDKERVGKQCYRNSNVQSAGEERKNKKCVKKEWQMGLVGQTDCIESKVSQRDSCNCYKGGYQR